jgi:orotate phosphoribosyltransferase
MPTALQALLKKINRNQPQSQSRNQPSSQPLQIQFLRWTQFEADVHLLFQQLPWPIGGIIGCPRSGMYAAAKLALLCGVPLWTAAKDGPPVPLCTGMRLELAKGTRPAGPLVLVEDSTNTAASLKAYARHCPPGTLTAVVYANPDAPIWPDFAARSLPLPHFFEWHYFGSRFAETTCFDMDGVICDDCPAADDDDGPAYAAWLARVAPRSLPRPYVVGAIVTARLQKYRPQTEAWLARYGVRYRELVMGPWATIAERRQHYSARRYKGAAYQRFPGFELFIESSPVQAAEIHQATGRPVACNQTGELWL